MAETLKHLRLRASENFFFCNAVLVLQIAAHLFSAASDEGEEAEMTPIEVYFSEQAVPEDR